MMSLASPLSVSVAGIGHGSPGSGIHPKWMMAPMTAPAVEIAAAYSRHLEDLEIARTGARLVDARAAVARRAGVSPGTLENLRRGRLKSICADVVKKIIGAMERALEKEIQGLDHELALVRRNARCIDPSALGEAEAALSYARQLLSGERGR